MREIRAMSEVDREYLYKSFKELKLKHFPEVVEKGLNNQDPKYQSQTVHLLKRCCEKEKSERKTSQIASRIKSAKFGQLQTVSDFDFKHSKMTQKIENSYLSMR